MINDMTIDEAIKHAKEQKEIFGGTHGEFLNNVSKWLEELEHYKLGNCMNNCEHYDNCSNYIYSKGYNKAAQDFYDKALNFEDYIEPISIYNGGTLQVYSGRDISNMVVKIKNELNDKT